MTPFPRVRASCTVCLLLVHGVSSACARRTDALVTTEPLSAQRTRVPT